MKINKDIKDRFDFFNDLLKLEKKVLNEIIILEPKKNNILWLIGQSNVQHITIMDNIIFLVERSKRDSKYGIKLRCTSLTNEPFFRFDSDGPAHRNDCPNIPLEEQVVTTPHFNSFDNNGKHIAYKNNVLKKENDSQAISEDITFGMSLFCIETNSNLKTNIFPSVVDKIPELPFNLVQDINFDNINFE